MTLRDPEQGRDAANRLSDGLRFDVGGKLVAALLRQVRVPAPVKPGMTEHLDA